MIQSLMEHGCRPVDLVDSLIPVAEACCAHFYILAVSDGFYDARSRFVLREMGKVCFTKYKAKALRLEWLDIVNLELKLTKSIIQNHAETVVVEKDDAVLDSLITCRPYKSVLLKIQQVVGCTLLLQPSLEEH